MYEPTDDEVKEEAERLFGKEWLEQHERAIEWNNARISRNLDQARQAVIARRDT
jgi:hypothetical protein